MPKFVVNSIKISKNSSLEENIDYLKDLPSDDARVPLLLEMILYSLESNDSVSLALSCGILDEIARLPSSYLMLTMLIPFMLKKRHRIPLLLHPGQLLIRVEQFLPSYPDHYLLQGLLLLACSEESSSILFRPNYMRFILNSKPSCVKIFYNMLSSTTVGAFAESEEIISTIVECISLDFFQAIDFVNLFACLVNDCNINSDAASRFVDPILTYFDGYLTEHEYKKGTQALYHIIHISCFEKEYVMHVVDVSIKEYAKVKSRRALNALNQFLYDMLSVLDDFYLEQNHLSSLIQYNTECLTLNVNDLHLSLLLFEECFFYLKNNSNSKPVLDMLLEIKKRINKHNLLHGNRRRGVK